MGKQLLRNKKLLQRNDRTASRTRLKIGVERGEGEARWSENKKHTCDQGASLKRIFHAFTSAEKAADKKQLIN